MALVPLAPVRTLLAGLLPQAFVRLPEAVRNLGGGSPDHSAIADATMDRLRRSDAGGPGSPSGAAALPTGGPGVKGRGVLRGGVVVGQARLAALRERAVFCSPRVPRDPGRPLAGRRGGN